MLNVIFGTKRPFCGTNWLLIGTIWPRNEITRYLSCLGYRKTLAIYHVKCHGRFLSSFWRNHGYFLWKISLGKVRPHAPHQLPAVKGSFANGESNRTYWLDWEMMWLTCHEHGTKKKCESPTGMETRTFRTPVGCSNHWATKDSWQAGPYTTTSNVEIAMSVINKEWW